MASAPEEHPLSRAVSALDLNNSLKEIQNRSERGPRYSKDSLFNLRPGNKKHSEHEEAGKRDASGGVTTPPYQDAPNPPPPTPTSPLETREPVSQENTPKAAPMLPPAAQDGPVMKKSKPKGATNVKVPKVRQPPPSGFEEFFADPPITPDEHEEESDIYDVSHSFADRMQTCIQRYRSRRKLDSLRNNVLTKYLALGGVETSGKMFTGGLDKQTLENSTAAEIAAIQATDYIRSGMSNAKYYDGSDNWVVDFEGVAKGFFSYRVPTMFDTQFEKDIKAYCAVIRNFLNYVLQHGVCTEYTADVMAARKVVDLAEMELWAIRQLQLQLPGDFNVAASTLYGGRFKDSFLSESTWLTEDPNFREYAAIQKGFSTHDAERIFKFGLLLTDNHELFAKTLKPGVRIVSSRMRRFEVVGCERATEEVVERFANLLDGKGENAHLKALGRVSVRHWDGPNYEEEDYSDDETSAGGSGDMKIDLECIESFWFEDELLPLFFTGMKLEAMVHQLSIGISFIDAVTGVFCSFHTYLPNEKMVNWKEPVPNPRPAPTHEDPEVEDRALDTLGDTDLENVEKDFKNTTITTT